ncbi:MAG: hypothetical protein GC146_10740 [Limimaricola sp.]|uniref:hypothetical protein n=1 Tax=Limimaricola sp. TaxID=2211665 RepID=UPI001DA3A914|nr:hypothetical protein [Limimaricola sp.]MBI1417687.1 hypothetical protein [Limimaricola sp.]
MTFRAAGPALALSLALTAGAATAGTVCALDKAIEVPLFHAAEASLMRGDFAGFFSVMQDNGLVDSNSNDVRTAIQSLRNLAPQGFDFCRVTVQRHDVGGAMQEIVVFHAPGERFPLFLYLAAMSNGEKDEIMAFRVGFDFREAVDKLF